MERLSRALAGAPERAALLPVLQPLSRFLLGLLADHNFKVALGGMAAIGDVADEVGRPMQSQLRCARPRAAGCRRAGARMGGLIVRLGGQLA